MALSKQEKKELLIKTLEKTKNKIAQIESAEKKAERKQRTRELIELGAFYFGDKHKNLFTSLKQNDPAIIALKTKIDEWYKTFMQQKKEGEKPQEGA